MEHPLVSIDKTLTEEQVINTINDLNTKLSYALRSNNSYVANQISMAIESYRTRLFEIYKQNDQNSQIDKYTKNIDIS